MKLILIPTDFSAASENALQYAMAINKKMNAGIILIHSYYIPVPTSEAVVVVPDKAIKQSAHKAMDELKKRYEKNFPEVKITSHITEGFPDIEILAAEKMLKTDLLVMGTRGMSNIKRFFMGSNTSAIIEKSICPVIAVPDDAKFRHLNKIVFAANYGMDDFANVFDLINFAKPFNAEIVLLHVSSGKSEKAFDFNQLDNFKNQIIAESDYQNISIKLLEDDNVYEGLNIYLEEINADMFAISMRNRSFLQNVFRPGLTRKMIYHTHIPVMVFHTDI